MTSTTTDNTSNTATSTSMADVVKEALALKKAKQNQSSSNNSTEKNYRIGMPPKGTRRAMGKR